MKKIFLVCLVLGLIFSLTACFGKKEEGGKNTDNPSSPVQESKYDFLEYIGIDRNGSDVKKLVSKVISFNSNNPTEKISMSLTALKGSVKTTSEESKLLNIYSYLGGNSSVYNVKAYSSVIELPEEGTDSSLTSSELSTATILFINVIQTEGTPSDPDIPVEVEETPEDYYFAPEEFIENV